MTHTPTVLIACLALAALSGCMGAENAAQLNLGNNLVDSDGDGVADAVEDVLCDRPATRNALVLAGLGACEDGDWTPIDVETDAAVPVSVRLGPDADNDGLPATLILELMPVKVSVFSDERVVLGEVYELSQDIDLDDTNPENPVVSTVAVSHALPFGVSLGEDADGDGLPADVALHMALVTVERHATAEKVRFEAQESERVPVDSWDDDPAQPVIDRVGIMVPTNVYHTGDADNDLLPASLEIVYLGLVIDRTFGADMAQTSVERYSVPIDDDDEGRDSHVPFSMFDGDGDFLPDAAEPVICHVNSESTEADGKCVRADGTGRDGSGSNYVPPVLGAVLDLAGGLLSEPAPVNAHDIDPTQLDSKDAPGLGLLMLMVALMGLVALRRH